MRVLFRQRSLGCRLRTYIHEGTVRRSWESPNRDRMSRTRTAKTRPAPVADEIENIDLPPIATEPCLFRATLDGADPTNPTVVEAPRRTA